MNREPEHQLEITPEILRKQELALDSHMMFRCETMGVTPSFRSCRKRQVEARKQSKKGFGRWSYNKGFSSDTLDYSMCFKCKQGKDRERKV